MAGQYLLMSIFEKMDYVISLLEQANNNNVSTIFTSITVLSAVVAVFLSYRQIQKSQNAIESSVFLSFSDRYNSEEMAKSLRRLRDFYRKNQTDAYFATKWNRNYIEKEPDAIELNLHRRKVTRYFMDVGRLYSSRLISKNLAKLILTTESSEIFLNICEPMNDARHSNRPKIVSNLVRAILSKLKLMVLGLIKRRNDSWIEFSVCVLCE